MERIPLGASELGTLAHMLRNVKFFSPLTVGQLDNVLPHVMLCSYAAGEKVFNQGEPGDAFHIIYQGSVEVRLRRMLILSKMIAKLGPGQFFGEIALVSNEPRGATIVCSEPTLIFTLMAADFAFVLRENPAAAAEMKSIAAQRKYVSEHAG